MSDFVPRAPESVALRPLTKGMVSNAIGTEVPAGAGTVVCGFYVEPQGLTRRPAWTPLLSSKMNYGRLPTLETGEEIQDIISFVSSTGVFSYVAITSLRLFVMKASDATWSEVPFGAASYAITSEDATHLNSSGADFVADGVRIGDVVLLGGVLTAIANVSATQLTFAAVPSHPGETDFTIYHRFDAATFIDFDYAPGKLLFTDNSIGGVVWFDGTLLTIVALHANALDPDPDYLLGAKTVMYFAGRVWLGCTIEDGSDGSRFIRWSSLTDLTEFAASDYILFNRETTEVLKLSSIEDVPVVYLENAIYSGYPSSLSGLPYGFIRVECGTASLSSPRALVSANNGQFFIGYDNIYFLSSGRQGTSQTLSVTPVGTPILNESIRLVTNPEKSVAFFNKKKSTIMFAMSMSSARRVSRTFLFNLQTQAWSYTDSPSDFFVSYAVLPTATAPTWDDFTTETWDDLASTRWSEYATNIAQAVVCAIDALGTIYQSSDTPIDDTLIYGATPTPTNVAIATEFDSGDLDFDMPDTDKVYTRVAIHLEDVKNTTRTINAEYAVALSGDKGRTWSEKGVIVVEPEADSDEAHFRFRDDSARVRLVSERTPPIVVSGIMLRVRPGEVHNVRD